MEMDPRDILLMEMVHVDRQGSSLSSVILLDPSKVELLVCSVWVLILQHQGVGCYLLCKDFLEQESRI